MKKRRSLISMAALAMALWLPPLVGPVAAQGSGREAIDSDSDPTRPVFFSIRPEYYFVRDGVEQRAVIVRYDTAVMPDRRILRGMRGAILRFEVPFLGADVRTDRRFGMGDAYGQFVVIPYAEGTFAWVMGSGVVVPTATDDYLGGGKLVIAPVIAPLWKSGRRMFFVKVQNFTSVAGSASRADVNYLLVTPTFVSGVRRDWWMLADSETRTDWMLDGRTGIKSGLQIGRRVARNVGLWIKPEVWWGPNRSGRWNLKFGIVWYQRRQEAASQAPASNAEPF